MKKVLFFVVIILLFKYNANAQFEKLVKLSFADSITIYMNKATLNIENIKNFQKIDSISFHAKCSYDYMYYYNKFKLANYYVESNNTAESIIIYKTIISYPRWSIQDYKIEETFFSLIEQSITRLIYCCRGNLKELKRINLDMAFRPKFYPALQDEIEYAGGVWEGVSWRIIQTDTLINPKSPKH